MSVDRPPETQGASGRAGTAGSSRATTGIEGLDQILCGGLPRGRMYLVRGAPGTGKTTLGLQFLLRGIRQGERALYITLAESQAQVEETMRAYAWSTAGLEVHAAARALGAEMHQSIFDPSDVELTETMAAVHDAVEHARADRVVVDSLAELRLLATDPLLYRRQVALLREYFAGEHTTAMLLDEARPGTHTPIEALVDGVLVLGRRTSGRDAPSRWLRVEKMRGVAFLEGDHDGAIGASGWVVYPRSGAISHHRSPLSEPAWSGIPELDGLTGGGLDRGSSALLLGPSGVGKSSVAAQYAVAAAVRGEHATVLSFHESVEMLLRRSDGIGMRLAEHANAGRIRLCSIVPAAGWSLGRVACLVRESVEHGGAHIVVLDGLAEYLDLVRDRRFGISQLHALLNYLKDQGVVTLLVATQSEDDVSALTDTVFLFRRYERAGTLGQALSIIKRRTGDHARTVHDVRLGKPDGIRIGPALAQVPDVAGAPTDDAIRGVEP